MTPQEFVANWQSHSLSERAGYQIHFNQLCELFGVPKPGDTDTSSDEFCFEKSAARAGKKVKGWADVWKRDAFAWEYKGAHKDLDAAYAQLLQYHDALGSPPVLVVCDLQTIIVRVKRTNRALVVREMSLESLAAFQSPNLAYLKRAFTDPQGLESGEEIEYITNLAASELGKVADTLQARYPGEKERVGRFLDRLVFGFFAASSELLPKDIFKSIFKAGKGDAASISRQLGELFAKMGAGGDFGFDVIRHFNGNLFDNLGQPFQLDPSECRILAVAAAKNWKEIDASIFGTLFERFLDTKKRSQLGAHYTKRSDIETLVEPVVLTPLRAEWEAIKQALDALPRLEEGASPAQTRHQRLEEGVSPAPPSPQRLEEGASPAPPTHQRLEEGVSPAQTRQSGADALFQSLGEHSSGADALFQSLENQPQLSAVQRAAAIFEAWQARLESIRVLDPACGSGAFLYVTLEQLLNLEKLARIAARDDWELELAGRIRPEQMLGLELEPYAHDLAQITVWIGFLQWQRANGYEYPSDPILRHTNNIQQCDALLDDSQGLATASEREWPPAEFIVGNPPFLGGSKLWRELGRDAQAAIWRVYEGRVPGGADLCCYWFEKARAQIAKGETKRAGLVATQAIRGGANREVLKQIKASGDIFFAVSDRDWELEGAAVHVSLIGFDGGNQTARELDTLPVQSINANLTGSVDVTQAKPLAENAGICFRPITKGGPFELSEAKALSILKMPNPHGLPNSDVLRPWKNGMALLQRPEPQWIIDPGVNISREDLELYEQPYFLVDALVRPEREANNEERTKKLWWLYRRSGADMRAALRGLPRYIATASVAKHRVFVWLSPEVLPDNQLYVFARSDDYFFGILHSRVHELWALKTGTQLEDRPRYTPTTCFDPFPFPEATDAQRAVISAAAATLNERREAWLNPSEWMREEIIEFRASQNGPWGAKVESPDARGVGTVRYARQVLDTQKMNATAFKREKTLTNLYNQRPAWLLTAHATLDSHVLAAYGLAANASDGEILAHLLDLNQERHNPA